MPRRTAWWSLPSMLCSVHSQRERLTQTGRTNGLDRGAMVKPHFVHRHCEKLARIAGSHEIVDLCCSQTPNQLVEFSTSIAPSLT